MKWSNKLRKWLRILHRDLGYLVVGFCIIYGVSGFLLNHLDGNDPAYKTIREHLVLPQGLSKSELEASWLAKEESPPLKQILNASPGYYRIMLNGGVGIYSIETGEVDYEFHQQRVLIYYLNKFHYNKVKGWTLTADFFAFSLIFLALSGLFMFPGKNGFGGRGKWFFAAGVLIPVVYIWLV
jgi:hypothetical protein